MTIYISTFYLLYFCVLAAFTGGAMGSFLHCAAWRMVRGESFLRGRSHCPDCGHVLAPVDLIPLLGWFLLRGKCRYCGKPIPFRYVLSELVFAALSVLCLLRFDLTVLCLRNYVFLCCLFCLSLVDLDSMEIPDGCLLIAALAWAVTAPFVGLSWRDAGFHLLAAVVFGGGVLGLSLVMDRLLGRESLGGGDIKLFALVGLYLGLVGTLFTCLLACVLGLACAALLRQGMKQPFPFGPAIAAAAVLMLFFGDPLVQWYLGLLGA